MRIIWVTGISGVGKSAISRRLAAGGHHAVSTDSAEGLWVDERVGGVHAGPDRADHALAAQLRQRRVRTIERLVEVVVRVVDEHHVETGPARDRLAAYKYPRAVEIMDEIPKTPTGKFLRRVLRDRTAASPPVAPPPAATPEERR